MKRLFFILILIFCLTKTANDQRFIESKLKKVDVMRYRVTFEDSINFIIYPNHRVFDVWNGKE